MYLRVYYASLISGPAKRFARFPRITSKGRRVEVIPAGFHFTFSFCAPRTSKTQVAAT